MIFVFYFPWGSTQTVETVPQQHCGFGRNLFKVWKRSDTISASV